MGEQLTQERDVEADGFFDEEHALGTLLNKDICFISGSDYLPPWKDDVRATCAVVVNCNDLFYWACADAEPLPRNEIENLYRAWKANPKWGVDRWCCLHRKLRPQLPIVADMKKDGFWDAELEALPPPTPS